MSYLTLTTFRNSRGRLTTLEGRYTAADLPSTLTAWLGHQPARVQENLVSLEVYENYIDYTTAPLLGRPFARLVKAFGRPLILRYPPDGAPLH